MVKPAAGVADPHRARAPGAGYPRPVTSGAGRSPLAVLHVAQPGEYGVVTVLAGLVEDQLSRGWRVGVAGPVPVGRARHLSWPAGRAPGPALAGEVRRLGAIVRDFRPEVVHLHSSKAGLAGRLLLRGRLPTIHQPHAWSFLALTGPMAAASLAWERAAARWATAVVCCSQAEQRRGQAAGIRAPWTVIPNPVDLDRFRPGSPVDRERARRELGLGTAPLVVCVGRLSAQKGQDVLLEAWPSVRLRLPSAELALVGEGPDREELEARAPPGVHFAGRQEDVGAWLHAADVVAQPSRYEGLSMAVLEAMASGRSVVASDVDGMSEAIGDDAGAVVPVEDAAALAAELARRLLDPGRAEAEGRAGRARAEQHHEPARWGQAVADLTVAVRDDRAAS